MSANEEGSALSASLVCADNLTRTNVDKAAAIIEAAVEAHGGENLSEIKTLVIESETENIATGQSRKAEPPWDRNPAAGVTAIDLENDVFATRNHGSGGGFEFDNATIINSDASYQIDYRAGTAATIEEPDFATTSGPFFRVTPALLVRQVNERAQNAYYLGRAEVAGRRHEVVGFSMEVGPAISLYFDPESYRLNKSERILPGIGLVEYYFTGYEVIDGVPFNRTFELFLNGDLAIVQRNVSTKVNGPLDALMEIDVQLERVAAVPPDPLSRQQVGDGVYLVGGTGTYVMFVEMDDYVIAVGGTAGIPDRIKELRKVIADKPIRYGIMTHHHFDHVMGVPVYAAAGAVVVAPTAHESVVRGAAPDHGDFNFIGVDDRYIIEDGGRRVEVIDIGPTAHTEHMLVTWLPEEAILFEADHFAVPANGVIPPAVSSTRSFAGALEAHNIEPAKILSAHSPRIGTMRDLRTALDRKPGTVARKNKAGGEPL